MSSFYDVTIGNATLAADINQYADRLNGTVGSQVTLLATANNVGTLNNVLPSAPGADQILVQAYVSGDSNARAAAYIRGSDGYGGFLAGPGGSFSPSAHLYAQAGGWYTPESLTVNSSLVVNGSTSLAGLNTSGNATVSGALTVSGLATLGHISSDGGKITSDANGNLTVTGTATLANSAAIVNGNGVVCDVYNARTHSYIGYKNNGGGKIAEMRGDFVISGTTFWTTQPQSGFNNSSFFDGFDVAEIFTTDRAYAGGVVVCPGADGRMHRCTHDGCHAALVVSKKPGIGLGAGEFTEENGPGAVLPDEPCELLAVAGRVRVKTSDRAIQARDLVTADGRGGVRGMRPGEAGFALGYALHESTRGRVGILIRALYCQTPAAATPPPAAARRGGRQAQP